MNIRRIVFIATGVGLFACFLTWLLMTDTSSPLAWYLLDNPGLRNLWGNLIFPVMAVSMLFGLPSSDFVGYPLVFLQWFIIGALAMFLWGRIFKRAKPIA